MEDGVRRALSLSALSQDKRKPDIRETARQGLIQYSRVADRETKLCESGHFLYKSTILFVMFASGVGRIPRQRQNHQRTPVILLNLNLPPDQQYKQENILTSFVIPGPKKCRGVDSFLVPLIEELEQLDEGVKDVWDGKANETFCMRA